MNENAIFKSAQHSQITPFNVNLKCKYIKNSFNTNTSKITFKQLGPCIYFYFVIVYRPCVQMQEMKYVRF